MPQNKRIRPCSSTHPERKRGRPKKYVFDSSRDSKDLKNSGQESAAAIFKSVPTEDFLTSNPEKVKTPGPSVSKEEWLKHVTTISESSQQDNQPPGQSFPPKVGNAPANHKKGIRRSGDSDWQPSPSSYRESWRKGKPSRAPFS